jgi:hypothetical protein
MASIIYTTLENGLERRFLDLIQTAIPKKRFEIFRTIGELSERLSRPCSNVRVAVLFSLSREDITEILPLGDLIADVKTILVLADGDRDTVVKAYTLRPRYVTWLDSDLRMAVKVLINMVALYDVTQIGKKEHKHELVKARISSPAMGKEA